MAVTDNDIDALTEAELMVLPESVVASGSLSRFWALHAGAVQKANADELALELTGASRSRRMIGGRETPEDREKREQKQRDQWAREMRAREDLLLRRIAEQEREIDERRQEIESRAIQLTGGRSVYVDGDTYRDADGRELQSGDRAEAESKRRGNSATWTEREDNERKWREAERLRREIEGNRTNAPEERETNLGVYEHEFAQKKAQAKAALNSGETDYGTDFPTEPVVASGTAAGIKKPPAAPVPSPKT